MIFSIHGKKISTAKATANIFGINTNVISLICVVA